MFKRLVAALAVGIGLCSVALAHPVRRDFIPDGLGFSENPDIEGRVKFHYDCDDGETRMRVNVDGLVPGQTYGVFWMSDGPWLDNPGAFTADCDGEGVYNDFQLGDASGDPVVIIYVDDPLGPTPGVYDPGEDRAFSYLPFTRIRVFEAAGEGLTESPCVEGMATVRYLEADGVTVVHLVMKDLLPFTTYGVKFEAEGGAGFDNAAAFTTNRKGNGKYDDDGTIGISTRNVVITIYINDDPFGDPFGFDSSEIRSSGNSLNDTGCD